MYALIPKFNIKVIVFKSSYLSYCLFWPIVVQCAKDSRLIKKIGNVGQDFPTFILETRDLISYLELPLLAVEKALI